MSASVLLLWTPIGQVPAIESFDVSGLDESVTRDTMQRLLAVDSAEWLKEIEGVRTYYKQFGPRLPPVLMAELSGLEKRLTTYEAVPTTNQHMVAWVDETRALCTPVGVHWVTGTEQEYQELCQQLVKCGTFTHPGSFDGEPRYPMPPKHRLG